MTDRLVLEPIGLAHAPLLVELDSDPEVMRFLTRGRASTPAEVEEKILSAEGHRWALFARADHAFVGWAGLDPTAAKEYELGYRLLRLQWAKGLATEASNRLLRLAFTEWGAERVWAQTMAVNLRSRAVMERCGLRFVRTFHLQWDDPIPGTEEGEVEYELRRADWLDC